MALYLGNDLVSNVFVGTSAAGVNNVTLNNPIISISGGGLIAARVTQSDGGFISANSSASSTLQLPIAAGATIVPSNLTQTVVTSGHYVTDDIFIAPVPTETKNITTNGTFTPATGKYFSSVIVNVPTGAAVNNQSKTVAPSDDDITVSYDSGYTGLDSVTVYGIPADYIGSDIPQNDESVLSIEANTVTVPAGYYNESVNASIAIGSINNPSAVKSTVSNHSVSITPTVNVSTGYVTGGIRTGAAITVTASELVNGNKEITRNGSNIDVANYATVTVNVSSGGGTAQLQAKTDITPTISIQTIVPDDGYDGLSSVQINAIPSTYKNTSDATAIAANILSNKTAYISTGKITGTMPNNGATGGTITTQGGKYTIPAGYTSGGTVTVNLAAGSTTATNISGAAFEESTGDYGFRTTVQIQPGYYASAVTVTKEFSDIFPAPASEATSPQLLAGYELYSHDGQLVSGGMTNNSIGTITLDQTTTTYTIPAGYHDGKGKVQHTTVSIPNPTISISASGLITASGSWTRGFTTNNSYSKTQQLTTKAAATITPGTTNQTIAAGTYLTGTQTIIGDADLVASNIISGKSIFGVNGNVVINKYYTGSSAPSSSLGSNGDIYLQE